VILLHAAFAQREQYHVDSWTTENGLPQNIIRDMCQTPDGYLWLVTLDGIVRFDGVRFVVFNRSNTAGIEGNRFTSLYCSPGGDFWAGTEYSGITRYSHGVFTSYTTSQGLPANDISAVIGDDAGHLWALSHTFIVQRNNSGFQMTPLPPEDAKCSYFPIGQPGFWCVRDGSVHLFLRGQFLRYPLPSGWSVRVPSRVGRDLNGTIWLADGTGRFARLSGGQWSEVPQASPTTGSSAKWAALKSTYRDRLGKLWKISIGTDSGAFLLEALNLVSSGKPEKIIFSSFFEDREGSVWLTTDGQGLHRLQRQTVTTLSKEEGLPDSNIYPIYQDHAGTIWIGTWNGGLVRYSDGKLAVIPIADERSSARICSIFEDRDGILWVATATNLYRRQQGRFELVRSSIPGGLQTVRAICQGADGALWFGTDHGLWGLKAGTWTLLTTKDGLATDDVRVVIPGKAGNLWIGGYGGLTNLDHGHFQRWTEASGLPSTSIRSLYEDPEGSLWIGTYDGGLGRLQGSRVSRFTIREGLFNNGVFQILEDAHGYLWMSCNRGIYRVSKSELNQLSRGQRSAVFSTVYGKGEGMRNTECNGGLSPAGVRTRDGKLFFPTQDGVAIVDPEAVTAVHMPPPVVIEAVRLDREPQAIDRPVRVPPGSENVEIEYTALSFLNSRNIPFRYRLEGFDRDWVEASNRRTAYYSHLPPGSYRFKVIAANSDGVWNTQGQSMAITVLPPFYRTWWFPTLALALTLGSVFLFWQNRVSGLKRAHAAQQAFARQLISSQEGERKRIAAELHDALGQQLVVIKNLALIALNKADPHTASRSQVEEISAQASLALHEVKKISYNLRPYQLDHLGLTKAIEGIVKQASDATTICFHANIDPINGIFSKEAEINFYRIVQECVNNLVKHSQATTASVTVRRAADELLLSIRDNGRGFTPGASNPGGRPGGFGLVGISERAQLLGGKLAIHTEPGHGTTVNVRIALNEDKREQPNTHRDRR